MQVIGLFAWPPHCCIATAGAQIETWSTEISALRVNPSLRQPGGHTELIIAMQNPRASFPIGFRVTSMAVLWPKKSMTVILARCYSMAPLMYHIIENNSDFVIIYKKPDTSFHSESGAPGLFETLKKQEGFAELFPVHRLDKVTSGLLVMAKNIATNHELTQAFSNRAVEKFYLAISAKKPSKKQGLIKGDMTPSRRGSWKLLTSAENPAITQFFNKGFDGGRRLFIVKPHTGKTHQIRVALKSLGSPILGDQLYSGQASPDRTYLHAFSLGFQLGNQHFRFTEPPREGTYFQDAAFTSAITEWMQPWTLQWPLIAGKH